jgi:hypothetical protein
MINGQIKQGGIIIPNNYAPYISAPRYVKQILLYVKREKDANIILLEVFNTTFSNRHIIKAENK